MTTWWKKASEKKEEPDRVWWEPPKITPRPPKTDAPADEFKAALDKLREAVKAYYG